MPSLLDKSTPAQLPSSALPAPVLVELPPGSFTMGASGEDKFATDTERPAHRVVFPHAFNLGRCPVTVGEYRAFAPGHAAGESEAWPVANVSWNDAIAYCGWLAQQTERPYRLPTEAEWEYACRATSTGPFSTGSDISPAQANFLYDESGTRVGPGRRTPVGRYVPNGYGLYDTHGNVAEWVADEWHPNYRGAPSDGSAWVGAAGLHRRRVIRGGGWDHLPRLLRCAARDALPETAARDNVGFRVALTLHA